MTQSDAKLDPWCTVALSSVSTVLFGFALSHPRTGGLAWTRSSVLVELDEMHHRAVTLSGTHYDLGTRFQFKDVADFGPEARLAMRVLLGIGPAPAVIVAPLQNAVGAERWLVACKVARHLGLTCPAPELTVIETFFSEYGHAYFDLRTGCRQRQ